jgi:diguanylate cyclase (GGDEF)-like protein
MQQIKSLKINEWSSMLGSIYDGTQNYFKSPYEIHCHLMEVTGAFAKFLFKKQDYKGAAEFLPKMFAWSACLSRKVMGNSVNLEEAILKKFPTCCPYCLRTPCTCWYEKKPIVNPHLVEDAYKQNVNKQGKTVDDFQIMFRSIYGESWGLDNPEKYLMYKGETSPLDKVRIIYTRMVEELSESAEAIRFHHLYETNFSNEIADYFAWWFALVSNYHRLLNDQNGMIMSNTILWKAYPGYCRSCGLSTCDCRPGPVRELLSKPALTKPRLLDGLTHAENYESCEKTIQEIIEEQYPVAFPISIIRIDINNFRKYNKEFSQEEGDRALRVVASTIRQKVRPRDRFYRVGGDEFSIICQDLTIGEAEGMMSRVISTLKNNKLKVKNSKGTIKEVGLTISYGITKCSKASAFKSNYKTAGTIMNKSNQHHTK